MAAARKSLSLLKNRCSGANWKKKQTHRSSLENALLQALRSNSQPDQVWFLLCITVTTDKLLNYLVALTHILLVYQRNDSQNNHSYYCGEINGLTKRDSITESLGMKSHPLNNRSRLKRSESQKYSISVLSKVWGRNKDFKKCWNRQYNAYVSERRRERESNESLRIRRCSQFRWWQQEMDIKCSRHSEICNLEHKKPEQISYFGLLCVKTLWCFHCGLHAWRHVAYKISLGALWNELQGDGDQLLT